MADNRKYYYLKLKENFFDSDSIVLLSSTQKWWNFMISTMTFWK